MADELTVKFAKITGRERQPERMLYSGFLESDDPKKAVLGRLFYFIEIIVPWFPNPQIGQAIISTLSESFYYQSSLDPALNLENALRDVNSKLADLSSENQTDFLKNLNSVLGVVKNNELVFSQVGNLSGYLFRKDKISQVTDNPSLKREVSPLKIFESLITGKLQPGDKILFANNELFNHISLDRIRINLGSEHIELGLEEVFKHLKKVKGREINVLTFEANTPEEFSNRTLSNCPDVFYLDLPATSKILHYQKKITPHIKRVVDNLRAGAKLARIGFRKSHIYFKNKIAPKMIIAAKRTSTAATKYASQANEKIMPKIKEFSETPAVNKVKTITGNYFVKSTSRAGHRFRFLKPYLNNLKVLTKPQYRKFIYGLVAVLILGLAYIKIHNNNAKQVDLKHQQEIADAFEQAKTTFEEAKTDLGLKRTDDGISKLSSALSLANKAKESSVNKEAATELYNQIQGKIDEVTGTFRILTDNPFVSLDLAVNLIKYSNNQLYLFGKNGQITTINTKTLEKKELVSLPSGSGEIKLVTINSKGDAYYIYTDSRRIFELMPDDGLAEQTIVGAGSWEEAVGIGEFADNLYLLDSISGIVWKHTPNGTNGYNKGKDYLDTSKVSIKEAIDITITGDIFVLQKEASIKKFSKGLFDETFTLQSIPSPSSPLNQPKKIVSDSSSNDLFVIDSNSRIVRYNRNGDFQKQYAINTEIISLAVNSRTQEIWLLSSDKIFKTSL